MTQRVAVVTGSNKGVGFAIVRALCKQLDNGIVYLTARNEERGREAVAKLNQEGLQPKFHQLDITDAASVTRLRDYLQETHGGLDILVNNAAIFFQENAPEPFGIQASVTMATDFTALLEVSRALNPLVRSHGRIVNVASMGGPRAYREMGAEVRGRFQAAQTEQDIEQLMKEFVECANAGDLASKGWPTSNYMIYGTAKLGVVALTRVMAAATAKDNTKEDILLTSCCPGHVVTDMSCQKGMKTIDEGAVTPVYLALLPPGSGEFNGKMFSNKALVDFWTLTQAISSQLKFD